MVLKGIPALDICVIAVRLNEWVLTPSTPMRLQASRKILSAINRVRRSVTPRIPGNIAAGLGWYSPSIAASPAGMSTIQVLCLPLVVDLRKVIAPDLISVV